MPGMLELLILTILPIIPTAICAVLARSDAKQRRRRLAKSAFVVACLLTLASTCLFLAVFLLQSRQSNAAGVQLGIAWFGFALAHLVIFFASAGFGAFGYFVSYRIFQGAGPEGTYGGDAEVQRVDETGNPYQPPST